MSGPRRSDGPPAAMGMVTPSCRHAAPLAAFAPAGCIRAFTHAPTSGALARHRLFVTVETATVFTTRFFAMRSLNPSKNDRFVSPSQWLAASGEARRGRETALPLG